MASSGTVDRPVFIVGCGRSGTTLLYDILCGHEDVGWFSNYTNRWPRLPILAAASLPYRPLQARHIQFKGCPKPSEGYAVWNSCRNVPFADQNRPLGRPDARDDELKRVHRVIAAHLRFQGKSRFLNKNTRNSRRIGYLNAMFSDAVFVHVLRDPRDVVSSLLQVGFWPKLAHWWNDDRTTADLLNSGAKAEYLAAMLWRREVAEVLTSSKELGPERYMEVRYEDFLVEPSSTIHRLLNFAQLSNTEKFTQFQESFELKPRQGTYVSTLSNQQLAEIISVAGELANQLGYQL